jgi:hypothetical protein
MRREKIAIAASTRAISLETYFKGKENIYQRHQATFMRGNSLKVYLKVIAYLKEDYPNEFRIFVSSISKI